MKNNGKFHTSNFSNHGFSILIGKVLKTKNDNIGDTRER